MLRILFQRIIILRDLFQKFKNGEQSKYFLGFIVSTIVLGVSYLYSESINEFKFHKNNIWDYVILFSYFILSGISFVIFLYCFIHILALILKRGFLYLSLIIIALSLIIFTGGFIMLIIDGGYLESGNGYAMAYGATFIIFLLGGLLYNFYYINAGHSINDVMEDHINIKF